MGWENLGQISTLTKRVVSNVAKREPPEMTHNIRWLEKFIPDFWTDGKKSSNLRNPKNCGIEDSSDSRKFESAGNSRGHEKNQPKHYILRGNPSKITIHWHQVGSPQNVSHEK